MHSKNWKSAGERFRVVRFVILAVLDATPEADVFSPLVGVLPNEDAAVVGESFITNGFDLACMVAIGDCEGIVLLDNGSRRRGIADPELVEEEEEAFKFSGAGMFLGWLSLTEVC